jgi:hypothetical protein
VPIRIFDASREELFNSLEDTETLLLNEGQKAVIVLKACECYTRQDTCGRNADNS